VIQYQGHQKSVAIKSTTHSSSVFHLQIECYDRNFSIAVQLASYRVDNQSQGVGKIRLD